MTEVHLFLTGASTMAYAIAAVFFARFWNDSRDRLFFWFGLAFLAFAANRGLLMFATLEETRVELYLVRMAGFMIIAHAIIEKNRRRAV